MQPVYINHIASIHADTASGESPYLSANEPDYKSIITNAALRRRMSRIINQQELGLRRPAGPSVGRACLLHRCGKGAGMSIKRFVSALLTGHL